MSAVPEDVKAQGRLAENVEKAGLACVLNPTMPMTERQKATIMLRTSDEAIKREAVKLEKKAAWLRSWLKEPRP